MCQDLERSSILSSEPKLLHDDKVASVSVWCDNNNFSGVEARNILTRPFQNRHLVPKRQRLLGGLEANDYTVVGGVFDPRLMIFISDPLPSP